MFLPKPILKKKPGDPILADEFNQLIERLTRLEKLHAAAPLELHDEGPNATLLLKDYTLSKRFQLLDDFARGDTCDANEVLSDTYNNFIVDTNTTFTVFDPFEIFTGSAGDRGLAISMPDTGDFWEIVRLQHIANWIYFRTTVPFSMMDETLFVDVIEYWDGYSPETTAQSSESSASGTGGVTIYNLAHRPPSMWEFHGSDNLVGYANYDNIRKHYRLIQLQCG